MGAIIVNLIFNALLTIAIIITMGIFFDKRRTSLPAAIGLYSLGLILTSVVVIVEFTAGLAPIGFFWVRFPLITLALFFVTLNYESTVRKTVAVISFMSFLLYAVNQFTFLFIDAVFAVVFDAQFAAVDPNSELPVFIAVILAQVVLTISIVLVFWAKFKGIKKNLFNMPAFWILPLIMFALSEATLLFLSLGMPQIATAVINFVLILLCFVILYLHDTLSANIEEKLKKEYYYTQCRIMQESAEQVNAVKHDIKSHLAALKDFSAKGDLGAVKAYLDTLVNNIDKSEIYSNTGNIAFDSIINYKLRNAESDNIKLDLNLAVPPQINIAVDDIVTVLGNLLDNALEAVAKAGEKFIKLDIEFVKGGLFAKIDNSFNGEIKHPPENELPASLKTGAGHGYGLKNIKQAAAKYDGHVKISYTEDIFSVGIFLYCV